MRAGFLATSYFFRDFPVSVTLTANQLCLSIGFD